jgi:hypothetical protein
MAELSIEVTDASVECYAAVPTLRFRTRLKEETGATIHAIALRTQVRIEPQRRRYDPDEEGRLVELFGQTPLWGDSLKPFLWTHIDTMITGFETETETELPVTCTYDFEVAGAKYLHGLSGGEVPLLFLFSGTVFTKGTSGFAVELVPWHLESRFRLPVSLWRQTMDAYFPDSGWLRLPRATIDRLQRFKADRVLPTWEETFAVLLKEIGEDT